MYNKTKVVFFALLALSLFGHRGLAGNLFVQPSEKELTLIVVKPNKNNKHLTPDQEESLRKLDSKVDAALTQVTNASFSDLGSDLVTLLSQGKSGVAAQLDRVRNHLLASLKELNADFPAQNPLIYNAYLVPFQSGNKVVPPIQGQGPFDPPRLEEKSFPFVFEGEAVRAALVEPQNEIGDAFFSRILNDQIQESLSALHEEQKFAVAGIVLQFKLQRNQAEVQVQILSALRPATFDFAKVNDQVAIDKITIPAPTRPADRLVALLSTRMPVDASAAGASFPKIQVQLGALGPLDGGTYGRWPGSLKVERLFTWADGSVDNLCDDRVGPLSNYTLALEGTLKPGAIENTFVRGLVGDLFTSLQPRARFKIFDLELDTETMRIGKMNVRVDVSTDISFLRLRCMNQRSVQEQLEGEFNSAMRELLGLDDSRGQELALQMFNAIYTL